MKNIQTKLFAALLLFLSISLASCEKDDPVPEIDQELITQLTLRFDEVDANGAIVPGSGFEVVAKDAEGISLGSSPQIEDITLLAPGKSYQLTIKLYNAIANEDMTEEVAEHGDEHQFFFLGNALVGSSAFATYSYLDEDENGQPIGLKGLLKVDEEVNQGTFRVVLRHGLNKTSNGADQPSFENFETAGGESDLDITFQIKFHA